MEMRRSKRLAAIIRFWNNVQIAEELFQTQGRAPKMLRNTKISILRPSIHRYQCARISITSQKMLDSFSTILSAWTITKLQNGLWRSGTRCPTKSTRFQRSSKITHRLLALRMMLNGIHNGRINLINQMINQIWVNSLLFSRSFFFSRMFENIKNSIAIVCHSKAGFVSKIKF